MKILVLCYEYPPIGGGGGRVAKSLAEEFVLRGHQVRVQTAALGWRSSAGTINGVHVFRTASGRRAPDTCQVHEMASYCATSFMPTLRHLRQWQPDVMHAHFAMPSGLLAWAAHFWTQIPYVLTAHLGDVPGGVPEQTATLFRCVSPIAHHVWRKAAACTAVSSFVRDLAQHAYGRPVHRVLNGVKIPEGRPGPPAISQPRHVVFLGRFNSQKRPDVLVKCMAELRHLCWRLTLIGDGPLMSEVRKGIADYSLRTRVRTTGWLASEQVEEILATGDILCMPSTAEGMPLAAIEALQHGLAIVASDIPGMWDVVADGVNGFRVPVNQPAQMSSRLAFLLEHESALLAMKRASWQKARDFDLQAIAAQYEKILGQAAAPTNSKAAGENGSPS